MSGYQDGKDGLARPADGDWNAYNQGHAVRQREQSAAFRRWEEAMAPPGQPPLTAAPASGPASEALLWLGIVLTAAFGFAVRFGFLGLGPLSPLAPLVAGFAFVLAGMAIVASLVGRALRARG